jgi:predicted glycosyltransferase involved in capsule biosynthesis
MNRVSVVVSVLDSHEVLRRQLLYLNDWLPAECELVVVDDGSRPALREVILSVAVDFPLTWCPTRDDRPWTQPRGRNIGARIASGNVLVFFDIDHILTLEIVEHALAFSGPKFHWYRSPAALDQQGRLVRDEATLREYGWDGTPIGIAANMFAIRREIFEALRGYDERFCGKYGGDDIDFNRRYAGLMTGAAPCKEETIPTGFVFPDPSADRMNLFHCTSRN